MELGGDEKKIQALFSDLSLEDQSRVPQFGHLWARAQAKKETAAGSLGRPLAVLVSLLVTAAACSLAVWTWYTSTQTPNIVVQLPPPVTSEARYTPTRDTLVPVSQPVKIHIRPHRNTTGRRQVDRSLATDVALLSNWQSPTQRWLESPTGLALNSLPQLNQSVKDLKSFLPKNNEVIKESNQ